jgi:hypothetical protein
MGIKNEQGIVIPISHITKGYLVFSQAFSDYGIEANHPYKIGFEPDGGLGAYFFADGCINLWRNELREDVCATATLYENKPTLN